MRTVFMVLMLVSLIMARGQSSGYKYRSAIPVAGTAIAYSSDIFDASGGLTAVLISKADDSTSAGFASDSIEVAWGYQLGYKTLDSAGNRDTAWTDGELVSVDTVSSSGLGDTDGSSYSTAQGVATYTWSGASGEADTTLIPGYAIQTRRVNIPHADLVRWYADGLTGNNVDTLDFVIEAHLEE